MECDKIRERLSDYLDGVVPPDEAETVGRHIASCSKCETAYSELKRTVDQVRNLEEVAPPQWMTQKIMFRVKEAGRNKGIWRKLFYPIHIKLPLEAAATILIAVTALYLFRSSDQEVTVALKQPEVAERHAQRNEEAPQKKNTNPALKKREPASLQGKDKLSLVPAYAPAPKAEVSRRPEGEEAAKTVQQPQKPAAASGALSAPAATAPAPQPEKSRKSAARAAGYGGPALLQEQRKEMPEMNGSAPAEEMKEKSTSAEAGNGKEKKAFLSDGITGEAVSLTLGTNDPDATREKIRNVIAKLGGRITGTQTLSDRTVVTIKLDSGRINKLFGELKTMGKIREKEPQSSPTSATVTVKIEIMKTP